MNEKERTAIAHMEWLTKYVKENGVYLMEDEIRKGGNMKTENVCFGWFDGEEFLEMDEKTKAELLKRKDFKEKMIEAVEFCFYDLRNAVLEDLEDIWKRLDRIASQK